MQEELEEERKVLSHGRSQGNEHGGQQLVSSDSVTVFVHIHGD